MALSPFREKAIKNLRPFVLSIKPRSGPNEWHAEAWSLIALKMDERENELQKFDILALYEYCCLVHLAIQYLKHCPDSECFEELKGRVAQEIITFFNPTLFSGLKVHEQLDILKMIKDCHFTLYLEKHSQ